MGLPAEALGDFSLSPWTPAGASPTPKSRGPTLWLVGPLDYLSFLKLESEASLILTDSGGVQEEACILKLPCVTIRENTERPETVKVGANVVAGVEPEGILKSAVKMMERKREWPNPFGDGHAAERIVKILQEKLS